MSNLVEKYMEARKQADDMRTRAKNLENAAKQRAWTTPPPANLRPATPEDIAVGAIIWYPEWYGVYASAPCWNIVDSVDDEHDTYTAHGGVRFGLHNAFVEDKTEGLK